MPISLYHTAYLGEMRALDNLLNGVARKEYEIINSELIPSAQKEPNDIAVRVTWARVD